MFIRENPENPVKMDDVGVPCQESLNIFGHCALKNLQLVMQQGMHCMSWLPPKRWHVACWSYPDHGETGFHHSYDFSPLRCITVFQEQHKHCHNMGLSENDVSPCFPHIIRSTTFIYGYQKSVPTSPHLHHTFGGAAVTPATQPHFRETTPVTEGQPQWRSKSGGDVGS